MASSQHFEKTYLKTRPSYAGCLPTSSSEYILKFPKYSLSAEFYLDFSFFLRRFYLCFCSCDKHYRIKGIHQACTQPGKSPSVSCANKNPGSILFITVKKMPSLNPFVLDTLTFLFQSNKFSMCFCYIRLI